MHSSQNVYQMVIDTLTPAAPGAEAWRHAGPVIVKRNSWRDGIAEVIGFDRPPEDWPRDKAPYFGNPKVFALIRYRPDAPYSIEELTSPGTYAYERLPAPPRWWRQGLQYPVFGYAGRQRLELDAAGALTFPVRKR